MDLWLIFLTGLTVGGLTCLAVQGGLLASIIAAREEEDFEEKSFKKHNLKPVLAFLTTKLLAYIILGFILGSFGGALAISDNARVIMQLLAGAYMIAIALNLLNVHPIFRYVIIQPPRFMMKWVKNTTKSKDLFAPALLGALTIFIPCGTTLAMEVFAISSGSPILGAAIMATFVLGTFPLFLGLGFLTTTLGDTFKTKFFKIAGILVLYLVVTSFNGALVLAGSPVTLQTIREAITICTPFSVLTKEFSLNSPSDKSIEIGIASRIVCKVTGDPAKTSAPLKEVTPKYKTSIPAILKNLVLKVSPKVVVKNPRPKNKGKVPKTNVAIIAAPKIGEPDDMAKTSMAKVVPQGIKIVKAPSRAGANKSLLLVVFLTHFIINRGGWIITYLKMGWTFNKFKAMAIM